MRQPHITRDQFETSYASILENMVQTSTEEYTSQQKKLWDTFIKDFKDDEEKRVFEKLSTTHPKTQRSIKVCFIAQ